MINYNIKAFHNDTLASIATVFIETVRFLINNTKHSSTINGTSHHFFADNGVKEINI